MKAIETRYAGHRFRSRTEARWAVFFDALGIQWRYEIEGYRVGPDQRPYLPDFHLPEEDLWVEVKGTEDQLDVELMVSAADAETGLPGARIQDGYAVRLLILGYPGRAGAVSVKGGEHRGYALPSHSAIASRDGSAFQWHAWFSGTGVALAQSTGEPVSTPAGVNWDGHRTTWGNFVGGGVALSDTADGPVIAAYEAARAARFEHGESGTTR